MIVFLCQGQMLFFVIRNINRFRQVMGRKKLNVLLICFNGWFQWFQVSVIIIVKIILFCVSVIVYKMMIRKVFQVQIGFMVRLILKVIMLSLIVLIVLFLIVVGILCFVIVSIKGFGLILDEFMRGFLDCYCFVGVLY